MPSIWLPPHRGAPTNQTPEPSEVSKPSRSPVSYQRPVEPAGRSWPQLGAHLGQIDRQIRRPNAAAATAWPHQYTTHSHGPRPRCGIADALSALFFPFLRGVNASVKAQREHVFLLPLLLLLVLGSLLLLPCLSAPLTPPPLPPQRTPTRILQISMDQASPADPAASCSASASPSPSASAAASAAASASGDVAAMLPDSPPRRGAGHRRAQSEILLGGAALPDDLTFDADLGVVGEACVAGDEDEEDEDEDEEGGGGGAGGSRMFEMFLENGGTLAGPSAHPHPAATATPPPRPRHQHSMSMDGSTSLLGSAAAGTPGRAGADAKKAISDAKLAELALVDPKRAKR